MASVGSLFKAKRRDIDMTEGSIFSNLIRFAFPLLLGNLFQQLYNLVDTWVIGRTGENGAFAAVGSVGPIINILIGFFLGLSSGAGVVISQYYGAKDEEKVRRAVHTSVMMTLILGVIFTVVGIAMTPWILRLMLRTSGGGNEIYEFARSYLTIYFAGVIGLMIYNIGAGILRAIGDSQHPFVFLLVSAISNIALDLLFVFGFDMGVVGVALATVISQALSAFLTVIVLVRTPTSVRVSLRQLRIDREMLGSIIRIGIPAAIQLAITSFANVFVQSYIANVDANQTHVMSGWTAYSKIDQFIFLPLQSLALAATTFVGQNLGKGNVARAKKGTLVAYLMATVSAVALIGLIEIFAPYVVPIINSDPEVVRYGTLFLRVITPFFMFSCVNQIVAGALRGAGDSKGPMFIMLASFVLFRQLYLFVVSNFISNAPIAVCMGYPFGWFVCCIITLIYFKRFKFEKCKIVEEARKKELENGNSDN